MSLHGSPHNDQQLIRDLDRRIRALENPRSIKLGMWMVSVSPVTGDLVADHIPSGRREQLAAGEPFTTYKED